MPTIICYLRARANFFGLIGFLPGELGQFAAEVAMGRGRLVDRPAQVRVLLPRGELEVIADQRDESVLGDALRNGAVSRQPDRKRIRVADGVGELHFALAASLAATMFLAMWRAMYAASGRPWSGPAAEGAAAMPAPASVAVNNDLSPGQAAVAGGTLEEDARRVDVIDDLVMQGPAARP